MKKINSQDNQDEANTKKQSSEAQDGAAQGTSAGAQDEAYIRKQKMAKKMKALKDLKRK